jgi:hypothetical protein
MMNFGFLHDIESARSGRVDTRWTPQPMTPNYAKRLRSRQSARYPPRRDWKESAAELGPCNAKSESVVRAAGTTPLPPIPVMKVYWIGLGFPS